MKTSLAAALLLLAQAGQAQVFRPGWVLPVQGDTLRGELEDDSWSEEPTEVRFRAAPGSVPVVYAGRTLQAFRLQGGQYFRREMLPLDRTARTQYAELRVGLRAQPHPESLLAEVLVDGPTALLHLTVSEVQHYFVRRPGQLYLELAERKYLRLQDGRRLIADGNNYRAELRQYFGDCPAAATAADRAAFTPAGLAAVVQAYNQHCDAAHRAGAEYRNELPHRRFAASLGLVGGVRYASFGLRGQEDDAPLEGSNFDGVLHPVGGAYVDVLFPARPGAVHLALLGSTSGREGAVAPAVAGGSAGYLHGRQAMLELRVGGRMLRPLGKQATQLVLGTGITVPMYLSGGYPTLEYTSGGRRGSGSASDTYPTSPLPYLEAGVRAGRLTLTAEGRVGWHSYHDDFGQNLVNGSNFGYSYKATAYYLGLSLGVAVLQGR